MKKEIINIDVKYFAFIRKKLNKNKEQIALNESISIFEFIKQYICSQNFDVKSYLLDETENKLSLQAIIFLNGEKCTNETIMLSDRDEIIIMTPIAGG